MESEEGNSTPDMSENSQSTLPTGVKRGSNSHEKNTQNCNPSRNTQGLEYHSNTEQERIPTESSAAAVSDGISPDSMGADGQYYSKDDAGRVSAHGFQVIQSGPIPPVSEMLEYKKVSPDFPDRIMTMAEKQQDTNIKTLTDIHLPTWLQRSWLLYS